MKSLIKENPEPINCKSDNTFKRAARKHQSDYRWNELHCTHDHEHKNGKYGAYLKWEDAQTGKNFYAPYWTKIKELISKRYSPDQMWKASPLYANMLRSEHIPYNIFVPMQDDEEAAKKVFDKIIGAGQIEKICDIKIEYAPEKEFTLSDGTSFDTFIRYQHTDGGFGGIGIEIKYTEGGYPLKQKSKEEQDIMKGENKAYINYTKNCGYYKDCIFNTPLPKNPLIKNNFRQIWRNHILGAAMLNNENILYPLKHFCSIIIFPSQNKHFTNAIPEYEEFLTEYGKKSFHGITYEKFFEILGEEYSSEKCKDWIKYLTKRYIF